MEYEAVVVSLRSGEAPRVHHELERFNALTRRGDTRIGGRGCPHTETNRDHSGGNGNQADLAHLSLPCNQAQDGGSSQLMASNMPDNGFGRCDGHHEMVDFRLEKIRSNTHGWKKSPERAGLSRLTR
jgi:hypothetical protein